MNLSENPQFYTDCTLAIREGESAIRALQGSFDPRAEDYADSDDTGRAPEPEDEAFEPRRGRGDEFLDFEDEQFGGSRGRAAFRRSAVKAAGAKEKKVVVEEAPAVVIVRDSRPYVADFIDRLNVVQNNLSRYSRWNLYEDFMAARRRLIDSPKRGADGEPEVGEEQRFQEMVAFLYELQHQDGIDERLSMLSGAMSVGIVNTVRGRSLTDGNRIISDQLLADADYAEQRLFGDEFNPEPVNTLAPHGDEFDRI